jgi:replicative superfamily II helicase
MYILRHVLQCVPGAPADARARATGLHVCGWWQVGIAPLDRTRYMQMIGRAGRAGHSKSGSGSSFLLCTESELQRVLAMQARYRPV